jgi:hypothetical protein
MPDAPQLERTARLEEDLVFVTLPVARAAESIPLRTSSKTC